MNDNAGVAGLLAKYQRRLGHEVLVVCRDGYDGFGQKEFYGVKIVGPKRRRFAKFGFLQKPLRLIQRTFSVCYFYLWVGINAYRFDVIHIHSQYLVSLFLPFSKKVIEFHGDDIRRSPSKRWRIDKFITGLYLRVNKRKRFLVSTPDLLSELPNCVWLPNPVDVEFFSPTKHMLSNRAVYFHNWYESGSHAYTTSKEHGLTLEVVDRVKLCHLFYKDMPAYIGGFDYMIDRKEIHSLSKTALEALAVGCKVFDWKGNVVTGLPIRHEPLVVAKKLCALYEEILNA